MSDKKSRFIKSLAIAVVVGAIVAGAGIGGALYGSGFPDYGRCANNTFKISHVYKPDHDQVISENSKNYMLHPFNKIGDIIPKEKALFIAFATYGDRKPFLMSIEVNSERQGAGIGYSIDKDISILYPLKSEILKGEILALKIIVNQPSGIGFTCTYRGTVQ
jgi:hypothetical protein